MGSCFLFGAAWSIIEWTRRSGQAASRPPVINPSYCSYVYKPKSNKMQRIDADSVHTWCHFSLTIWRRLAFCNRLHFTCSNNRSVTLWTDWTWRVQPRTLAALVLGRHDPNPINYGITVEELNKFIQSTVQ